MEKIQRERIKTLIELSSTIEEADEVLSKEVGLNSLKEKLAFLKGMFDEIEIINQKSTDSDELLYTLWLHAIIEAKWNNY